MKIKKALVLYKRSAYSSYFLDAQSSLKLAEKLIPKSNMRSLKLVHTEHYTALAMVEQALKKEGISYIKSNRGQNINYAQFDLVITVGGDGTFLEAARNATKQLVLGVNSSPKWSVGKFCVATAKEFPILIKKVKAGKFKVRKINRLQVKGLKKIEGVNVLNDVLIAHHNPAAMSRYCLSINGITEEQKSSGIWISTAAGTTGAIHSAGGKVLPDTSLKFQYFCREPYYGKRNSYRLIKGILAPNQVIKVTSLMREGMVFLDGSRLQSLFHFGQTITIKRSPHPLKIIYF
ncbi:MAG: hypothetical protein A2Z88_05505 [Omnitrophica WOR_2 bacterium GWA2_47_8]|nr:MAG: hypothetical protein A2Z88_05505 [Omnitrophica WOR_2 bacterium GWA2_47_8]